MTARMISNLDKISIESTGLVLWVAQVEDVLLHIFRLLTIQMFHIHLHSYTHTHSSYRIVRTEKTNHRRLHLARCSIGQSTIINDPLYLLVNFLLCYLLSSRVSPPLYSKHTRFFFEWKSVRSKYEIKINILDICVCVCVFVCCTEYQ